MTWNPVQLILIRKTESIAPSADRENLHKRFYLRRGARRDESESFIPINKKTLDP